MFHLSVGAYRTGIVVSYQSGHQRGDVAEVWATNEDLAAHSGGNVPDAFELDGKHATSIAIEAGMWLCIVDGQLVRVAPDALFVLVR